MPRHPEKMDLDGRVEGGDEELQRFLKEPRVKKEKEKH